MSNLAIEHVFVLMLENHSFDHLLGLSGIPGINGLVGNETNEIQYRGTNITCKVNKGTNDPILTDPGHEFLDALEQLCGPKTKNPFPAGPYPAINNSGFVSNYAASTGRPGKPHFGDVMGACDSASQVPVLYKLATEFAVCDHWFSSMPGPTWPNRLFAMGASSSGLDDSPTKRNYLDWINPLKGFEYVNGSIFQHLQNYGLKYRLYNDRLDQFAALSNPWSAGSIAIVTMLRGIHMYNVNSFDRFASDLQGDYPYQYTFIEPNYGDVVGNDYDGGSSQHPMDSLAAGEAMIAATYYAIRNSPHWERSLLIITYDEHGGFYDHAIPPEAISPNDGANFGYNTNGFDFTQYGVRVPAVVVSPLIPRGTVDSTVYDHTSILRTVENLHGLPALTDRDAKAKDLLNLPSLDSPRTDCPLSVSTQRISPAPATARIESALARVADLRDDEPLPQKGNVLGFLYLAAKADAFHSETGMMGRATIFKTVASDINTKGQARAYFRRVMASVQAAKARRGEDFERLA